MNVDYSPFNNKDEFLRWVASYHGTNVSNTCEQRLETFSGKAMSIVDEIQRATRAVDLSKNGFRAKFVI